MTTRSGAVTLVLLGVLGCGQASDAEAALPEAGAAAASLAEHRDHGPRRRDRRVEYLERFYRHFSDEREFALAVSLPEDMTWNVTGWRTEVVPFAGAYVGRRAIWEHFRDYFGAIDVLRYRFEYKLADAEHVSWHFRLTGRVPSTGKTFDAGFVHVWKFGEDGRPVTCRTYYDTQLLAEAFTVGGPRRLADRRDPDDDHQVRSTPYDVEALVAQVYDRFYGGDIPGVFAMLSEEAAVYFQGKDNPQSGEYHGFDGLLQFVMNLAGTARPDAIERFFVTEGDRTDVVLFEHWTVYATGKSYHVHTVNSWRVDAQGKLLGFVNYPDVDEVAAAYVP